jgi:hypothetical protein
MREQGMSERVLGEVPGQRWDRRADIADHGAVPVAVRLRDDPVVDPREFLGAAVQDLRLRLAERPPELSTSRSNCW